jgi:hypothetical protein
MLFREFFFGFLQLLLESVVGMQRCHNRRTDDPRRIHITLPVVSANHAALA